MQYIGKFQGRGIYWLDYDHFSSELPDGNWICLAVANQEPDFELFEKFVKLSVSKGILEFKGHGKSGEIIHDWFDDIISLMMIMDGHSEIDVMTTWHNDETLANSFWQCFHATCLPETADFDNLKIICTDLDGINRTEELKIYTGKFEEGWLPISGRQQFL
jgi:hypothetical protein